MRGLIAAIFFKRKPFENDGLSAELSAARERLARAQDDFLGVVGEVLDAVERPPHKGNPRPDVQDHH